MENITPSFRQRASRTFSFPVFLYSAFLPRLQFIKFPSNTFRVPKFTFNLEHFVTTCQLSFPIFTIFPHAKIEKTSPLNFISKQTYPSMDVNAPNAFRIFRIENYGPNVIFVSIPDYTISLY